MEYLPQHSQSFRFVGGAQMNLIRLLRVLLFLCTSVVNTQLAPAVVPWLLAIPSNRCRHFIARYFLRVYANQAVICFDWHWFLISVRIGEPNAVFVEYLGRLMTRLRSGQTIVAQLQALVNVPKQQLKQNSRGVC